MSLVFFFFFFLTFYFILSEIISLILKIFTLTFYLLFIITLTSIYLLFTSTMYFLLFKKITMSTGPFSKLWEPSIRFSWRFSLRTALFSRWVRTTQHCIGPPVDLHAGKGSMMVVGITGEQQEPNLRNWYRSWPKSFSIGIFHIASSLWSWGPFSNFPLIGILEIAHLPSYLKNHIFTWIFIYFWS
jgi:hypothetical protein